MMGLLAIECFNDTAKGEGERRLCRIIWRRISIIDSLMLIASDDLSDCTGPRARMEDCLGRLWISRDDDPRAWGATQLLSNGQQDTVSSDVHHRVDTGTRVKAR